MNGVLQKERVDRETEEEEDHVKMEAEWSYAAKDKECIPEAGRGKEGL